MLKKLLFPILFFGLFSQLEITAQSTSGEKVMDNIDVHTTRAIFLGKTKPVNELVEKSPISKEKKQNWKRSKKKPPNFIGRGQSLVTRPELEHQGPDPVRQKEYNSLRAPIETLLNFDGIGGQGSPHDPSGDVGPNHYVQAVNGTIVRIFDKAGNTLQSFNMNSLWTEFSESGAGDPIILYDEELDRWILTEFAGPLSGPAWMYVAISETPDPTGSYFAYSFMTMDFPDYPKFSLWPNALVVTTNEGSTNALHQYFIQRDSLMAGAETVTMQRIEVSGGNSEAGFLVTTPVDWNGNLKPTDTRPMTLRLNDSSWGQVAQDQIEVYHFDVDFDDASNTVVSNTSIVTAPFDGNPCSSNTGGFACIPQLNGGGLDGLPELILNLPHYRNFGTHESVVFNFITDVANGNNVAGLRWVELRKLSGASDWVLYQEGTYAPEDGLHRFMGSMAIDKNGNIGMAYNVSSEESYVGIRYTGRTPSDPLGQMTVPEQIVIEGGSSIFSGGRFGDYPQMSVDPIDQSTFWYTTEYATDNDAGTRIVAFQISKDTFDLNLASVDTPNRVTSANANQPVTVTVSNGGLSPMFDFEVGFSFEGGHVEQIQFVGPLLPDSSLEVSFTSTVDLSTLGDYALNAYVVSAEDENARNDTLKTTVSVRANFDGALSLTPEVSVCSDMFVLDINLENAGVLEITTADIEITVDGSIVDTFSYAGNIVSGASDAFAAPLGDLAPGTHEAEARILTINGNIDEVSTDNIGTSTITQNGAGGLINLNIVLDDFPEESAWTIIDSETNTVLAMSNAYTIPNTTVIEDLCLAMDRCYTLTFTDAAGDGLCCGYGQGFFTLLGSTGDTLFESDGNFGTQVVTEFCLGTSCNISAVVDLVNPTDAGAVDGTISIVGMNGSGNYHYSIDSGISFQDIGLFDNLPVGDYMVVVQDVDNKSCTYEELVSLTFSTATKFELDKGVDITVFPNPNNGFFKIEVAHFDTEDHAIDVEVRTITGQLVQTSKMAKYDNVFTGQFSLVDYPDGTYLIRFASKDVHAITKVVKQQ